MKRLIWPLLLLSHLLLAALGFALGIYTLPILTAPASPAPLAMMRSATQARYVARMERDLQDSDWLHWAQGTLRLADDFIAFDGAIAPGPDYKLYLSPQFVETEADFLRLKSSMVKVGDVRTFDRFILPLSEQIELARFNSVIIWCESFGQFISAARYRPATD